MGIGFMVISLIASLMFLSQLGYMIGWWRERQEPDSEDIGWWHE